jgi:hypothetical protein
MTQNEKLFVTALILATEGKDRAEEAFHWHLEHSDDSDKRQASYRRLTLANANWREARRDVEAILMES